jgi:hypothetical protein
MRDIEKVSNQFDSRLISYNPFHEIQEQYTSKRYSELITHGSHKRKKNSQTWEWKIAPRLNPSSSTIRTSKEEIRNVWKVVFEFWRSSTSFVNSVSDHSTVELSSNWNELRVPFEINSSSEPQTDHSQPFSLHVGQSTISLHDNDFSPVYLYQL